jgi:DNA-binding MarR family transcriptional regulator
MRNMKSPKSPTPIDERIREALSRLATALRSDDWLRAKAAGVNPTQYAILDCLQGRADGLGVKEIAFQLGVSQPTATDSVAALERKALVVKRASDVDRRAVHVGLTPDGRAALRAGAATAGVASVATAALSGEDKERLLVLLIAMIRQLQEADAIPIQRMCVSCRHFRPHAHSDAARPHHCNFVNAAFGQRDLRIDCRDHDPADPSSRAATWDAFQKG